MIPSRGQTRIAKMGGLLSFVAVALFMMPVLQAKRLNDELPAAFATHFGSERRERSHYAESPRAEPLVFPDLVRPVALPAVRFEERVLAKYDQQTVTLDIYQPGYEHGPLPGVIVVHGGQWQSGDNSEFVALNAYLAGRDYIVAAINYRLAPRWPYPAGRDDVLSAIAYLKVYASQFGLDPTRLALLGRSAGGQLALLAAYTASEPAIRGVISMYGPTDLRFGYEHPAPVGLLDTRKVLETYLGGPPSRAEAAYYGASPINFVTAASPPTLLIHGLRDQIVSPDESARLDDRLQHLGVKHLFVRLPWATHGCDKSFGGPCGQIATYAVERFLDGVMAASAQTKQPAKVASNRPQPAKPHAAHR